MLDEAVTAARSFEAPIAVPLSTVASNTKLASASAPTTAEVVLSFSYPLCPYACSHLVT